MLRTLFLNPPSFEGFDGGAGARYQATREIRSYWYPTWLAQPAAIVPGSKLIDAPPAGLSFDDVIPLARGYDLVVVHTSSPTFAGDVKVAEALKAENPSLQVGFVGPKVAVQPERSLLASAAIDFVAREEFDFTVAEVAAGRPLASVDGISYRDASGQVVHNADREVLEDMDRLPFVTPVYKRDLPARGLLHRVSAAPLPVVVYRAGVPVAVHVLLVAADGGGAPVPDPQRGRRAGRGRAGQGAVPAGEGAVLRR